MADEEEGEPAEYAYEGERGAGEEVALSVTAEVDGKPRHRTGALKLLGPREGAGKAAYPNGDAYEGGWAGGARDGQGTYAYAAKGGSYEGGWRAGLRHGLGAMRYGGGGGRYHGFWAAGLRHGQGAMYYASKDIYTGEWRGGKRHGSGVYHFAQTGGQLRGTWAEGRCVAGSWVDKGGVAYTGTFGEDGLPAEGGEYAFPSGLKAKGAYAKAKGGLQWVHGAVVGPAV